MSILEATLMLVLVVLTVWALGSAPTEISFNGRPIPNRPRWWPLRGLIALFGMLGMLVGMLAMVIGMALMPVMFLIAIVHDAIWPRGKRWVKQKGNE